MTAEQRSRADCLIAVLRMFPDLDPPSVEELIAYAEWVADGSIGAATAIQGQRHALYVEQARREEEL